MTRTTYGLTGSLRGGNQHIQNQHIHSSFNSDSRAAHMEDPFASDTGSDSDEDADLFYNVNSNTRSETLLPAERNSLLDRIRQLSCREAETAASLAQMTAENEALAEEMYHWKRSAKEASLARRAAREALAQVSQENARLAAAYNAQRLESDALRQALAHQGAEAGSQIYELQKKLKAAQDAAQNLFFAHVERDKQSNNNNNKKVSNTPPTKNNPSTTTTENTPPPHTTTAAATTSNNHHNNNTNTNNNTPKTREKAAPPTPNNKNTASSAAWEAERQELLDLLERLQDQLDGHACTTPVSKQKAPSSPPLSNSKQQQNGNAMTPPLHSRFKVPCARESTPPPASPSALPNSNTTRMHAHTNETLSPTHSPQYKTPFSSTSTKFNDDISTAEAKTPIPNKEEYVQFESSFESNTTEITDDMCYGNDFPPIKAHHPAKSEAPDVQKTPPPRQQSPPSPSTSTKHASPSSVGVKGPQKQPLSSLSSPQVRHQLLSKQHIADIQSEADALMKRKHYDEAIKKYTVAVTNSSRATDQHTTASLLCSRATAFLSLGRFLESAADCCQAHHFYPHNVRAREIRADAFHAMGAYDLAVDDLVCVLSTATDQQPSMSNGGAACAALHARIHDAKKRVARNTPANHYAVLSVRPSASPTEIKSAYKILALKLHPDKATESLGQNNATMLFSLLSSAHTTLSNAQSRRAYDLQLLREKYSNNSSWNY